ncbi:MAG: exonuclease, partial [Clostridia bacterium]|nr:exonuclease [Clostridia bacterium]
MNYIFLDMEWDNYYSKKFGKFVNEIVQIGAVKLDSKFHIVSDFNIYIKSEISKKLSSRFKRLTNITNEQMLGGVSFCEAIKKYKE